MDGIPEQLVLGIGLAAGDGVSIGLLAAIFVSNLPEAVGSATEMRAAGRSRAAICGLWIIVAMICTLATVAGYGIADAASGDLRATINGFAAGALLVMLIDSMIPEAARQAGKVAGLVTVLGFRCRRRTLRLELNGSHGHVDVASSSPRRWLTGQAPRLWLEKTV